MLSYSFLVVSLIILQMASATWTSWGAYGTCSVSCGLGTQTRSRVCIGTCNGPSTQQSICQQLPCATTTTKFLTTSPPVSYCTGVLSVTVSGKTYALESRPVTTSKPFYATESVQQYLKFNEQIKAWVLNLNGHLYFGTGALPTAMWKDVNGMSTTVTHVCSAKGVTTANPGTLFAVGNRVEANFGGRGRWFTGAITKVNTATKTYSIQYDDGDTETNVAETMIRKLTKENRSKYEELELVTVDPATTTSWSKPSRGTIKVVQADGRYTIEYLTGYVEKDILASRVHPVAVFKAKQSVQASLSFWYKATIDQINPDGTYVAIVDGFKQNLPFGKLRLDVVYFSPGQQCEIRFKDTSGNSVWLLGFVINSKRTTAYTYVYTVAVPSKGKTFTVGQEDVRQKAN